MDKLPSSNVVPQKRIRLGLMLGSILAAATVLSAAETSGPDLTLRYDKPATKWTEALPVGNGRIGAMVFGGTEDERLQINEGTLWGGGPHDYTNPEAYSHLDEVRKLIFAGKVSEAEKLSETMMGRPKLLMPYQPFCDVRLHFGGHAQATEYRRELHLDDAIAETAYKVGDTDFRREVFISHPDQVLVMRITAKQPGQITFSLTMDSPQPGTLVESSAKRYVAADWPDPTTAESTVLLDGLMGEARDKVRRSAKSVRRRRFRSQYPRTSGNFRREFRDYPVQ